MPDSLAPCAVLLLPGFPLVAAGALLGAWGMLTETRPVLLSMAGGPVASDHGMAWPTDVFDAGRAPGPLWLLGAEDGELADAPAALLDALRAHAGRGGVLAALGSGVDLMAQAGLLDGQRACAPWPIAEELLARHGGVVWSPQLWEMSADGLLLSAAPGVAVLDLLLAWLARHDPALAQDLAPRLGLTRGREARERQPRPSAQANAASPKLREALALMEANLAEPLPTEDVARLVGVSRRQLERLFKQHLDSLPARYYLELRLQRARRLLQQGSQSILQIGLSSGFSSGPHFSNAYKSRFGHTPREERSVRTRSPAVGEPQR